MKPVALSSATSNRSKPKISIDPATQTIRIKGAAYAFWPRKEVKKPSGQKVLLVASATEALPTQTPIAPQVQQETRQTFTSMDDQQVMAGLNIAMQLLAAEPQIGAFEPVEIDDQSIAQLNATDPQEVTAKAPKSPRNSKKQKVAAEPVQLLDLKFLTIPQTATRYQVHTEKALRHLQAQAEAYLRFPKAGLRSNGFIECVFRPDGQRKILIIAEKYEQWLVAHSSQQLSKTLNLLSIDCPVLDVYRRVSQHPADRRDAVMNYLDRGLCIITDGDEKGYVSSGEIDLLPNR